jgi:hypothetical protein
MLRDLDKEEYKLAQGLMYDAKEEPGAKTN